MHKIICLVIKNRNNLDLSSLLTTEYPLDSFSNKTSLT